MDMQLNPEILRREREIRAWSQSHLAEVAGLSMRTVQRIERTGSASQESAKALASALDTQVENLLAPSVAPSPKRWPRYALGAAITFAGLTVALLWASLYLAPGVIDLVVSSTTNNGRQLAKVQLLSVRGQQGEMEIEGLMRVKVSTRRMGEGVLLSTQVYGYKDSQYQLKAKPAILAAMNETAKITMDFGAGEVFEISLKPRECGWWWSACLSG